MIERYTLPEMADLWSEQRKFETWLRVELAILWARMKLNKIQPACYEAIGLNAAFNRERIAELEEIFEHDMIAFVETVRETLRQRGVSASDADEFHRKHTSYDIEDPALMLLLLRAGEMILEKLSGLRSILLQRAMECRELHMIARTHVQFAEPSVFGQLLLVYSEAVDRARQEIGRLMETNLRVGKMGGAVGTYAGLDPQEEQLACERLGLVPARAATQILQRDRHARFLSAIATAGGTIEQIARTFHEMMHSCVGELQEPRKPKQRGSSAMPFKINPILTERLFGLPRVLRGYLVTAQENIATIGHRDISQSGPERIIFPDSTTLLHYMVAKATSLVKGLVIFPDRLEKNLERSLGVWAGQRIRSALVDKDISDNDAYEYVQRISFKAVEKGEHVIELLAREPISELNPVTACALLGTQTINELFDVDSYIKEGIETIYSRFSSV